MTEPGLLVRSTVTVGLDPLAAFRLFTDGMSSWWPFQSHSIYGDETTGVVVEPWAGGRVYETTADGRQGEWGIVSVWQPGERLVMSWHPGNDAALATRVDVTFSASDNGGTRVELLHTGWEVTGADAPKLAESYETGWGHVLGRFFATA